MTFLNFAAFSLLSQNPEWIIFDTTNSGLPNNIIQSMDKDIDDNIWITTYDGLTKFDGNNWTTINKSNSNLPDNKLEYITIDSAGNKWLSMGLGDLAKFDGNTWTTYNYSNSGLPYTVGVSRIAIDINNDKWVGTWDGGLAKFDGSNWTIYNSTNSNFIGVGVSRIAIDQNGNKWMCPITCFDLQNMIINHGGLVEYDGSNWTVYDTTNSGIPSNSLGSIEPDKNGNIWIGSTGGLTKFDGTNWTTYDTSNSNLPKNFLVILAIAIDINDDVWLGTVFGGLVKFDGINMTVYDTSNSDMPDMCIKALVIDSKGNKWIATCNSGLVVYRKGGVILSTGLEANNLYNIYVYPNPTVESLIVSFYIKKPTPLTLKLIDSQGQEIRTIQNSHTKPGQNYIQFNMKDIPNGIYFIQLITKFGTSTNKLIKMN